MITLFIMILGVVFGKEQAWDNKKSSTHEPMIMRYTDAEAAVFSVVNGVICSAFVPILFSICY